MNREATFESLLEGLNPEQRKAVTHTEGPLLVVAGPGTGKTRVITARCAYLIQSGVEPSHIAGVTFTNKAAEEMRTRLTTLVDEKGDEVTISTLHALAARILRAHAETGISYTIYSEEDQEAVIREVLKQGGLSPAVYPVDKIQEHLGRITNQAPFKNQMGYRIDQVVSRYQNMMSRYAAVDLDYLIVRAVQLCSFDGPLKTRFQFRHVLVDEAQDLNRSQYQLVRCVTAAQGTRCLVGDPDQSIYGWRGADPKIVEEFLKDDHPVTVIRLENNYRSTPMILGAANRLIAHNPERLGRELRSIMEDPGAPVEIIAALDPAAEASQVVKWMMARHGEGVPWAEFGVLVRLVRLIPAIEQEMIEANIPYNVVGATAWFETTAVRDILSFVKVAMNQNDSVALRRCLKVMPGIGPATRERLERYAEAQGVSLWAVTEKPCSLRLQNRAEDAVSLLRKVVEQIQTSEMGEGCNQWIDAIIRAIQCEEGTDQQELDSSIGKLRAFAKANKVGMMEMMERLALGGEAEECKMVDAVKIMTMHSAKGLEFQAVCLVGMQDGVLPNSRTSIEEERRLAYVGVTRAKSHLCLTYSLQPGLLRSLATPSPFLEEMGL